MDHARQAEPGAFPGVLRAGAAILRREQRAVWERQRLEAPHVRGR